MTNRISTLTSLFILTLLLTASVPVMAGDDNEVKFTGAVESLPAGGFAGTWRVAGRTIQVTNSTSIEQTDGRVAVGAIVKVEGYQRADGSIDAKEIEVNSGSAGGGSGDSQNEVNFKGTIQTFPAGFLGDWNVGGRTIHVSAATRIEAQFGPVAVGAFVEVKGAVASDNSIDATKIEVKSNVGGGDGRHEVKGNIQSLPSGSLLGDWVVGGTTVHVSSATFINQEHGAAAVGVFVEVHGSLRADGSFDATRIEIKPAGAGSGSNDFGEGQQATLKGAIQSLPGSADLTGDWLIRDTVVHVTSSTKRVTEHGQFGVGVSVKVKGLRLADGSVVATKIVVRHLQ